MNVLDAREDRDDHVSHHLDALVAAGGDLAQPAPERRVPEGHREGSSGDWNARAFEMEYDQVLDMNLPGLSVENSETQALTGEVSGEGSATPSRVGRTSRNASRGPRGSCRS